MPGLRKINPYSFNIGVLPKVTMADPVQEINVSRAQWMTNVFHFIYATAKACLFPFLTIYLRYLGLTAIQTGIIYGLRSFLTVSCGALWNTCAKKFNKQRVVLMFSLYCLIGVFIALTFVPPVDQDAGVRYCHLSRGHINDTRTGVELYTIKMDETVQVAFTEPMHSAALPSASSTKLTQETSLPHKTQSLIKQQTQSSRTTLSLNTIRVAAMPKTSAPVPPPSTVSQNVVNLTQRPTITPQQIKTTQENNSLFQSLTESDIDLLKSLGLTIDDMKKMSEHELEQYLVAALQNVANSRQKRHGDETKPGTTSKPEDPSFYEKFKSFVDNSISVLMSKDSKAFTFVLILICIAGLFGSPVDRLIDDCWFQFLDNIDVIEKYGQHALFGTAGFILAPVLVTVIIDHVPCTLPFHMYNFAIHVFAFAAFCAVAFILALFYPIYSISKKRLRKPLMAKGMKTVCNDVHAATFAFTMFITGLCEASVSLFLFWKIQDLHGGEMIMGTSVAAGAIVEVILFFVNKSMIKKLGNGGGIVLSMVIMSGCILFYSFLPFPWLAVAGEALHGFSNALLWHSTFSYPDFRVSALVTDRSAASTLNNIYHAFGFSMGCVASGILAGFFGITRLFQGTAGLLFLWALICVILLKCVRKKQKVRYTMLLQGDNDADDSSDEDWLEVALKEVK